nr:hypothetical protein GCM10020241_30010 [Streptoalloteichus tenebrarius]
MLVAAVPGLDQDVIDSLRVLESGQEPAQKPRPGRFLVVVARHAGHEHGAVEVELREGVGDLDPAFGAFVVVVQVLLPGKQQGANPRAQGRLVLRSRQHRGQARDALSV